MREIGLVFQLSPDEVSALIGRAGAPPDPAEAGGSGDAATG